MYFSSVWYYFSLASFNNTFNNTNNLSYYVSSSRVFPKKLLCTKINDHEFCTAKCFAIAGGHFYSRRQKKISGKKCKNGSQTSPVTSSPDHPAANTRQYAQLAATSTEIDCATAAGPSPDHDACGCYGSDRSPRRRYHSAPHNEY